MDVKLYAAAKLFTTPGITADRINNLPKVAVKTMNKYATGCLVKYKDAWANGFYDGTKNYKSGTAEFYAALAGQNYRKKWDNLPIMTRNK